MTTRQRVVIPGVGSCDLLPLGELEEFAYRNGLDVTYPVGDGWATTRLAAHGWAAWYAAVAS